MREENDHAAHAGDRARGEEVAEIAGRHRGFNPVGQVGDLGVDHIHRILGERENAEEEQRHHGAEHEPAPDGMGHHGVDLVRGGRASFAGLEEDFGGDAADGVVTGIDEGAGPVRPLAFPALLPGAENFPGARMEGRRSGHAHAVLIGEEEESFSAGDERGFAVVGDERSLEFGDGGCDGRGNSPGVAGEREIGAAHRELEFDEAPAVDGFAGDDGDAEFLFEAGDVDGGTGGGGEVHHVDDEKHRPAEVENLVNEVEVSFEIGRVDDAEDAVGLGGVGAAAEEDVAGDGFVGGAGGEGIGAGQVDDGDGLAVLRVSGTDLFLDGDAGVVPDFLFQAGEGVEKGAFAAVGIADEGVDGGARGRGVGGAGRNVRRQSHRMSRGAQAVVGSTRTWSASVLRRVRW